MKTKRTAFRPALSEPLESRTVLSGYGGLGMMGGGYGGAATAQYGNASIGNSGAGQAAQSVANDFQTFENTYLLAIYNDLQAPATPNVAGFSGDKTVAAAFSTLSTNLGTDVASLAPANPKLAGTLQSDVSSLQTTLNGLTTPANSAAVSTFQQLALQNISQTYSQAIQQISSAAPPAGTVTQQSLSAIESQIGTAVQTFNSAVNTAFQAALPVSGSTTTPTAGAFASAVKTAASALTTSVTGAVTSSTSALPSALAASLSTTLTADVNNLQGSLTSLTVPTSSSGYAAQTFASEAESALAYGEQRLDQDLITAVQTNNQSLSPASTTPASLSASPLTSLSNTPATAPATAATATTPTLTSSKKLARPSLKLHAASERLNTRLELSATPRGHARRVRL